MRKISRYFMQMRAIVLVAFGKSVENKMTAESGLFPDPTPPISTLSATRLSLVEAIANAEAGGLVQRQERNALEVVYKLQLLQLSEYVAMQVSNDEEQMERSGFTLTKKREKVGPMPMVTNVSTSNPGFKGEMGLHWNRIYGAQSYSVQYRKLDSEFWSASTSNKVNTVISFLQPRTDYVFRVAAVGAAGQGPWSEELTAFVN